MLIQIHDELLLEVADEDIRQVTGRQEMVLAALMFSAPH